MRTWFYNFHGIEQSFSTDQFDNASKNLKSNYEFIQGDYSNNIRNFYKFCDEICGELQKDIELVEMLKNNVDKNCYCDPKLKTLTTDFIFYIGEN